MSVSLADHQKERLSLVTGHNVLGPSPRLAISQRLGLGDGDSFPIPRFNGKVPSFTQAGDRSLATP